MKLTITISAKAVKKTTIGRAPRDSSRSIVVHALVTKFVACSTQTADITCCQLHYVGQARSEQCRAGGSCCGAHVPLTLSARKCYHALIAYRARPRYVASGHCVSEFVIEWDGGVRVWLSGGYNKSDATQWFDINEHSQS